MSARFSFKEVTPCLFAIFIDVLGLGLVAPLLIAMFTSTKHNVFGISSTNLQYFFLGLSLALYPLCMFFGTSFIGDLSDIVGRKKMLIFSMSGMSFSFLLMGFSLMLPSLILFLVGRALAGLVAASQSVALATISDLSTPENKAIHLSYVSLIQCLGFVVGPVMGGVLSNVEFYLPFFGAAFFALIAVLWIAYAFEETFIAKGNKKISLVRLINVFKEAYKNKRVRDLCKVFLLMQIGVGICLTVVLIILNTEFNYSALQLGLFNGYLGLGFALGLLLVLPRMLKRFKIQQIVYISLFVTFISMFLTAFFDSFQIIIWLLAFPFAIAIQIAFSGMFTSFSNATDEASQGWVMGISVAVMAVAWAIAGFSSQIVLILGSHILVLIGSICLLISALMMRFYFTHHIKA